MNDVCPENFGSTCPEVETLSRELTRSEKVAIRKLVIAECANFSREYGCLQIEDACYMLGKCWTGAYCKYFKIAVLPLDPILQSAILGGEIKTKICAICGEVFYQSGRKAYCSDYCIDIVRRKKQREYLRKKRGSMSTNSP